MTAAGTRLKPRPGENVCHHCGDPAPLVCDYFGLAPPVDDLLGCPNYVCLECAIPQFAGGDATQYTLCRDHSFAQMKKDRPLRVECGEIWDEGKRRALLRRQKTEAELPVYLL